MRLPLTPSIPLLSFYILYKRKDSFLIVFWLLKCLINPKALTILLLIPSIRSLISAIICLYLVFWFGSCDDLLFLIYVINIFISRVFHFVLCARSVCPSQFCVRSYIFFGWLFFVCSRYIPQTNKYIRLRAHVSQGMSSSCSRVAFFRGRPKVKSWYVSPCNLKGREDDEIQFGESSALWKHYQRLPFASMPQSKPSVSGLIFNDPSSDFIISQGLRRRSGGVGRRCSSEWVLVRHLVPQQPIALQEFCTPDSILTSGEGYYC